MLYDISELLPLQRELDNEIQELHHLTYESTSRRRILALIVEVSELANATRTFKFWSLKGPEGRERVLDEAADCLHFFLGIFIENEVEARIFDINPAKADNMEMTDMFIDLYQALIEYSKDHDLEQLLLAFRIYLQICLRLGFNNHDMVVGYKSKLRVNYNRQANNY